MEKKYINESRYKKSSNRKRRTVQNIGKVTVSNTASKNVKPIKKPVHKIRKRISPAKVKRNNIIVCIVLLIIIAIISRAILKDKEEPFIPISFGVEENTTVLKMGIVSTEDISKESFSNSLLSELNIYASNMLLRVDNNYKITYDCIKEVNIITNKSYELVVNDKKDVTAKQIKDSLQKYVSDTSYIYNESLSNVSNIEISGEKIQITLKKDDPYFVYNLEVPVDCEEDTMYVKSKSTPSEITFDRAGANKQCPKQIVVKRYKDMYAEVEAYKNEEINMFTTNISNSKNLLGKYEYNVKTYTNGDTVFLFENNDSRILKNKEVRQAICYGIDRDSIVKDVAEGSARIIDLPYIYDTVGYKYDIYAAENMLLSNGYKKSNKVYYKTENGSKTILDLTLIVNKEDTTKVKIANKIKNNLASIGISVTVEKISSTNIAKRVNNGDYDLLLASVNLNKNPNIDFVKDYLFKEDTVNSAIELVNNSKIIEIQKNIENLQKTLSKTISCIGIYSNITYCIYNKEIVGINDMTYMNVFKDLMIIDN